jgi:hypothetical protein
VWVEILPLDGFNLLISNRCFAPDTTADTFKWYFVYLEYVLDTYNFCVLLLGDFNLPLFKKKLELSPAISQYYNNMIHIFLHVYSAYLSKIIPAAVATCLTLCFSNFTDLSINHAVRVFVSPDTYHPPFVTEVQVSIRKSNHSSNVSFRKHSSGDYLLLYSPLATYD